MSKLDSIKLADYTRTEDWINSISHMVGGGLSVLATLLCIYKAFKAWSWQYIIAALIYGFTMIAMYTCSAVYHALRPNNGKKAMRMVDHSMIYLMIAGTITPFAWLVIMPVNFKAGVAVLAVAWVTVVIAMFMTFFLFNTTKTIQMILYLALGWMIIVYVRTLWNCIDHRAVYLLVSGGIAYTLGAILYGIGAKKKYFHSVFHFFVLAGSILHFFSLFLYVFTV